MEIGTTTYILVLLHTLFVIQIAYVECHLWMHQWPQLLTNIEMCTSANFHSLTPRLTDGSSKIYQCQQPNVHAWVDRYTEASNQLIKQLLMHTKWQSNRMKMVWLSKITVRLKRFTIRRRTRLYNEDHHFVHCILSPFLLLIAGAIRTFRTRKRQQTFWIVAWFSPLIS
jgi:hypothetical protein